MMDWNGHVSGGGWFFSILTAIIVVAITARDRMARVPHSGNSACTRDHDGRPSTGYSSSSSL